MKGFVNYRLTAISHTELDNQIIVLNQKNK